MTGFVLTWLVFGLVLVLLGARAWVVETGRSRFTTGGATERRMTAAVAASVALLVVLLTFNGGTELFGLLLDGDAQTAAPADAGQVVPGGAGTAPPADPLAPGQPVPPAPGP